MFRGMRTKTAPGLSSQSRIVRCPKCHKLLQEPIDATIYKCSGCNSLLQAKRWDLESNDNSIQEALIFNQNRSLSTKVESTQAGSITPMRSAHWKYNSRASSSVERGYHSETVSKNETSDRLREWMRRADEYAFASARSSPYNSRSNASERRYQVPSYPASPSSSSAYEYGYSSPFHGSQASASEQSYYGREGWFQESSSAASPIRFPGETSDGKYHHSSSQSQMYDPRYHNLYVPTSCQEAAAPVRSRYSEHFKGETSSEKSSHRDKKKYIKKRTCYVLPSAGGAPFATCSYCLELLQLPQVSLNDKHTRYEVRCGSCSGVLKFSVQEKADAEETVTYDQDSASEGHEEIYPEDSHLSCSDNGSGDRICKSNDAVIREQQPVSSESIRDTSKNHLEEATSEKSTEMDNNIFERVSGVLEGARYENNEILKPEGMSGDVSGESLEAETGADRHVSHSEEPNQYVCETGVLSESTGDTQEFVWEETQENEEYGSGDKREDIMRDLICESSSSNGELYEDTVVKEDTKNISAPVNENQRFIEHPDQSGEATVTTSRIHDEQSKYEYENLSERQELDETISDRVRYELEESRYETNEVLDTGKVSEDGPVVSLKKASETFKTSIEGETGEERLVSHQMDFPNENVEDIYERLKYAGERTWEETMEDRAGLHLEEYESNYKNNSKPFELTSEGALVFNMHEYELGMILEPEEAADGRLESSSSSDHESAEESAKSDQSQYVYEIPSERQELSNTVQEYRCETNETFEPSKMVGDGSLVTLEKASETNISETGEEMSVFPQMAPENENLEEYHNNLHEWTSERAPTFRLHEYELGTMLEPEEDVNGRSSSSTDFTNDHESSEEKDVVHEAPSVVDENKTEELKVTLMVEDGPSFQLEKCENESITLEDRFEWTSERAPTFRLQDFKLGTMLEPKEDADRQSDSSSSSSFNDQESLSLEIDSRTKAQQVEEVAKDTVSLHLECENESMKLDKTFEWTSERALTFSLREYELETMLELQAEDAEGRSASSLRGSFNDHVVSKEGVMEADKEPSLHLEKCVNEKIVLDQTLEPSDDIFKLSLDDTLEQERITFHLEMSQDKQVNLRQTITQGDTEENIPASEENEKSGLTSEPYSQFYNTTDPSEIVGLRLALYQTPNSPLRSPYSSPIHTPTSSPLHILRRSPIASPMHSHIVSPMRSPINSSGSLSDILFFGKKA